MHGKETRRHIETLFATALLGPGSADEVLRAQASDIYLTGILWPRGTELSPEEDDSGSAETADDDDDASPSDAGVPGYRAIRPCSAGLTFETDIGATIEISLGSTARYRAVSASTPAESVNSDDAPSDLAESESFEWHRTQLGYRLIIDPQESRTRWRTSEFLDPEGRRCTDPGLAVDIHRRHRGERWVVTVTLINVAEEAPIKMRDATLLFQTELRITATHNGQPAIHPRSSYPFSDDEDHLINLLLYRDTKEFAVGHGVSAGWSHVTEDRTDAVWTTWLPHSAVIGTNPGGHASLQSLQTRTPSPFAAQTLSDATRRTATCTDLDLFCDLYQTWIAGLSARKAQFTGALGQAAASNEARCAQTLQRLRRGVAALKSNDVAWHAFVLANQAMDQQARFPAKAAHAKPLVWRPFQLAFLLLVLPGLIDAHDPDRDTMDLLWFPTGGGKTEAYLALTAFEIFRRRLTQPSRREVGGTDVLMRYTLRLLTIQQFQRAAALIAACESLRRADPGRLGEAPISLGLYVGATSTPNTLAAAHSVLQDEREGRKPASTPRQLLECPACAAELPTSAWRIDAQRAWMDVTCPNSNCPTAQRPLPVLTVDEAIYDHPPSLLIATIDKFAQMPRNGSIRRLFGRAGNKLGLIIQDELHLISGPLGSMAGLYEATVDLLCTDGSVRPKIIGSTATIGRAKGQVLALFDRDVLQFPPPGFEAADSFFAVRDVHGFDRLYYGISTAGRSPKFALQGVLAALMQAVQVIRSDGSFPDSALDPYWTCVAYFNSLRELGGAHVLMQDDVRRQIAVLATRSETTARLLEEPPLELSSRVSSREIPEYLKRLAQPLGADDPYQAQPPDAVLASNMISVGVDVPRLGLMVVAGQPKSTAEYIQATSRVGRSHPGLVVTLYNFGRPRDLSHFEHFLAYHSALYLTVEATSVTPWAPRARDKALHAVFVAAVRHLVAGLVDDDGAIDFSRSDGQVSSIIEYLIHRARSATAGAADADIRAEIEDIARDWERKASNARAAGRKLNYWEKKAPFGKTSPYLLHSAEQAQTANTGAWPAPNSLREVEPSTAFVLRKL